MPAARSDTDTLTRAEEAALARAKRNVGNRSGGSGRRATRSRTSSGGRGRKGRGAGTGRFATLDLLRGLAVIASVVLLAGTAAPATLPTWATPSAWHGMALADLVLPTFLVAAGTSIAVVDRRRGGTAAWRRVVRVLRRTVVLVALGLAVAWLADPTLDTLRWTGVLQRIAVATFAAWLLTRAPRSWQVAGVLATVAGWGYALERVTVDGLAPGLATPAANVARSLDTSLVAPAHLAAPTDPLGIATTLPAAVLVVIGVWVGTWILARPTGPATTAAVSVAGGWLVVLGVGWAQLTPLNATLWTPSYLLLSAGACLILLGAVYLATEVLAVGRALAPIRRLGENALVAYLVPAATVAATSRTGADGTSAWSRAWDGFFHPVFGPLGGLALGAGLLAATVWITTVLDRRGWRLRA